MDWIPIAKQQPPVGHVLVTVLWEKDVDTAFDDDYEVTEMDYWVERHEQTRASERVIAWMPLPQPYVVRCL